MYNEEVLEIGSSVFLLNEDHALHKCPRVESRFEVNTRVRVVYYGNVHTFFMSCHFEVLAFKFLTAVSDSVDIFERNHFKSKHKLVVEKLTYMSDI